MAFLPEITQTTLNYPVCAPPDQNTTIPLYALILLTQYIIQLIRAKLSHDSLCRPEHHGE